MHQPSKAPDRLTRLFARRWFWRALTYTIIGVLLLLAIALIGKDIVHHIDSIESWITRLGPWGVFVFICVYVSATSAMMPESVLSIAAGAMFGLVWGLAAVVLGSLLAAALQYALSRKALRDRIRGLAAKRPSLAAIQLAVRRNELKLQVLFRLTPLNPATMNYLLGAAGVRFWGFLLACLAAFPHLLLEVYVGFAGKHFVRKAGGGQEAAYLHDAIVIAGLVLTVAVIVLVSRMAQKALREAMPDTSASTAPAGPP